MAYLDVSTDCDVLPQMVRWQAVVVGVVAIVLPLASALVTYMFVTLSNEPLTMDDTGGLIIMIVIAKVRGHVVFIVTTQ